VVDTYDVFLTCLKQRLCLNFVRNRVNCDTLYGDMFLKGEKLKIKLIHHIFCMLYYFREHVLIGFFVVVEDFVGRKVKECT